MTADDFQAQTGVSRETLERLQTYAELLVKWQARINLVGPSTLPDLWRRHMLDSAQLYPHCPQPVENLVDLGTGAGFPGLVLAIMGARDVHLVESDSRKCAFLREAARVTGASVTIHNQRIEQIPAFAAKIIVSRALAPVEKLLDLAEKFLVPDTVCLFLKGRASDDELTAASKEWIMAVDRVPSLSDPDGLILRIGDLHRGRA